MDGEATITEEREETEADIIGELEDFKQKQISDIDNLMESIRSKRSNQEPELTEPQRLETPIVSNGTQSSLETADAQPPISLGHTNEPVTPQEENPGVAQTTEIKQVKIEDQVTEQQAPAQAPPVVDAQKQIEDIKKQINEM